MPLILGANSASGGYEIDNSLRFNSGSSDNLSKVFGSAETSNKIGTLSFWFKALAANQKYLVATSTATQFYLYFEPSSGILWQNGATTTRITSQVFRDPSAWYHLVVSFDTTQGTASNRQKMYLNGSEITAFSTSNDLSLNQVIPFFDNDGSTKHIGSYTGGGYYDGYISEFYGIDGQQLTPSSFGQTDPSVPSSGIWIPKAYTGSYGNNGFYLQFKNSAALGTDSSGNGNTWTVNNLTSIDQTTDTPTNNFCTMNPLLTNDVSTFSEGNCKLTTGSGASTSGASIAMTQGKWFAEFTCTAKTSVNMYVGLIRADSFDGDNQGDEGGNIGYIYSDLGRVYHGGAFDSYGNTWSVGDIIGIAFDADSRDVTFYKNGVSQGVYTRIASENAAGFSWFMVVGEGQGAATATFECNFGNPVSTISSGNADANGYGNFEYAVPSGYYALCTKNLAQYG